MILSMLTVSMALCYILPDRTIELPMIPLFYLRTMRTALPHIIGRMDPFNILKASYLTTNILLAGQKNGVTLTVIISNPMIP